jgi:hypothetical protein
VHLRLLRAARLSQPRLLQVMWVGLLMRAGLLVALPDGCCWLGREAAPGAPLRQVGRAARVAPPAAVSRSHRPDASRPPQPVPNYRRQIAAALAVALHWPRALPRPVLVLVGSLEIRRGVRYGCRVRTPPGI